MELPKVIAAISLVHVPIVVESTICPHCGELNIDNLNEGESGKTLTTSCTKCDKDYLIQIPTYEIINSKIICP